MFLRMLLDVLRGRACRSDAYNHLCCRPLASDLGACGQEGTHCASSLAAVVSIMMEECASGYEVVFNCSEIVIGCCFLQSKNM